MNLSFLSWGMLIGRVQGIPIYLHWTFLLFAVLRVLTSGDMGLEALWIGALFGSVLLHELGHCWEGRRHHLGVDRIMLSPLGGLAYVSPSPDPKTEIKVAVAGPWMHIPIAMVCTLFLVAKGIPVDLDLFNPLGSFPMAAAANFWTFFAAQVIKMQIALLCFNLLLPAYPMDGGRVLVALLSTRTSIETTCNIACVLSAGIGIGLILVGGQFSVLIGIMLMFEALQLQQLKQIGELRAHPMFLFARFGPAPRSGGKKNPKSPFRVLRPVPDRNKICPECKREVPASAVMCGFCEREV